MSKRVSIMDMGKTTNVFLDSWKKDGRLIFFLHPSDPWTRHLHSFRRTVIEETGQGQKKKVLWYPYTCWEPEEFHKARKFEERPPLAEICPFCRVLDHFAGRDDIDNDGVIFRFGSGRDMYEIAKADFLGWSKGRDAYKDKGEANLEYVISVITADDQPKLALTNEKFTIGKKLSARIKKDIEALGDKASPLKQPIAYCFEFDKEAAGSDMYSVQRWPEAEVTDEVRALWDSPAPDATPYTEPSDPRLLLKTMQAAAESAGVEDVPWGEIFDEAIAKYAETHPDSDDGDDEDSDDEEVEKEEPRRNPPKKTKSEPKGEKAPPKKDEAGARKTASKKEDPPAKEAPAKRVKKAAAPPKEEETDECPECGKLVAPTATKCRHCGCEFEADGPPPREPGSDDDRETSYPPPLADDDIPF